MMIRAEDIMFYSGIAAVLTVLYWVRKRELREKFALGWLAVGFTLLICGISPTILMETAHRLTMSYAALVAFITAGALFLFAFFATVSISRQYRRNIRLTQEIALLKERVDRIENGS